MKYRLLDLLQSIDDGSQLRVVGGAKVDEVPFSGAFDHVVCGRYCAFRDRRVKEANLAPDDCAKCYSREIVEGELEGDSGKRYRILGGIPRLLSDSTEGFLSRNRETFSLEWKYSRFGERNWGMDIESRKRLFVRALGEAPEVLRGKLICDAGCGSGLLSMEMGGSFGMEVVAFDLSTGIENAYVANTSPFVYYVQASVLEPPLKPQVADYVYCAGVLVHISDTWAGFRAISRCVRPGGRCFVWLYHPLERHRETGDYWNEVIYEWLRSRVTSRLPIRLQEYFYMSLLPLYFAKRMLLNPFTEVKEDRTWREKMQNLIDTMSPVFANRHTEEETVAKFLGVGYENVVVAYRDRYGFGVRGDIGRK